MKPAPFKYHAPATVDEALALLAKYGYDGKVLAGGQSLVPMMNFRLAQPGALVDLNNISELFFIQPNRDGSVRIGAMTRERQVEQDPRSPSAPMVHAAMPIAYPQIRTRGTSAAAWPTPTLGELPAGGRGAQGPHAGPRSAGGALGGGRPVLPGAFTTP
jgi:carbon-monoxide dehydrogenase medium subunit